MRVAMATGLWRAECSVPTPVLHITSNSGSCAPGLGAYSSCHLVPGTTFSCNISSPGAFMLRNHDGSQAWWGVAEAGPQFSASYVPCSLSKRQAGQKLFHHRAEAKTGPWKTSDSHL